jgi:hypothetical protein
VLRCVVFVQVVFRDMWFECERCSAVAEEKQIWMLFFSSSMSVSSTSSFEITGSRANDFWYAMSTIGLLSSGPSSERG